MQTRQQFAKREWLGQIVVSTRFKSSKTILNCRARGEHQDWSWVSTHAKFTTHLISITIWKQHVEHNYVVVIDRSEVKSSLSVFSYVDSITLLAQAFCNDLSHPW